jgi:hypothetical protein
MGWVWRHLVSGKIGSVPGSRVSGFGVYFSGGYFIPPSSPHSLLPQHLAQRFAYVPSTYLPGKGPGIWRCSQPLLCPQAPQVYVVVWSTGSSPTTPITCQEEGQREPGYDKQ